MVNKKRWIVIFLAPAFALFLLVYLIPLVTVFVTSFFDYRLYPSRFNFIGFQNYIKLFTADQTFLVSVLHTFIWVFIQCIFHVGMGVIIALVLSKKLRGWKFVRTVYMIPNIISASAIGMIFLNFYNPEFGALNMMLKGLGFQGPLKNWLFDEKTAFPAVTMTWFLFAGYTTTLVLAQILSISEDVFEAAKVDGANSLQTDFYVTLPMLKPIIATTMTMGATYMLQMFALVYLTTKGGPGTATMSLPLYVYKTAMIENNYGYANTVGVFIIILGLVFMTMINKLLRVDEAAS